METTITVFAVMMAVAFVVIGFGFLTRKSLISIMGGVLILAMSVGITAFVVSNESFYVEATVGNVTSMQNVTQTTSHYQVNGTTGTIALDATNLIVTEIIPTGGTSALEGDEINCIDLFYGKDGTLAGAVDIGVWDDAGAQIIEFDTFDASTVTNANQFNTHCLTGATTHTIAEGDHIGIAFTGGDATNNIDIGSNGDQPFDSTLTYRALWTGAAYVTNTANDLTMRLYLTETVEEEVTEVEIIDAAEWVDHQVTEQIDSTARFILGFFGVVFIVAPILTFKGFTI